MNIENQRQLDVKTAQLSLNSPTAASDDLSGSKSSLAYPQPMSHDHAQQPPPVPPKIKHENSSLAYPLSSPVANHPGSIATLSNAFPVANGPSTAASPQAELAPPLPPRPTQTQPLNTLTNQYQKLPVDSLYPQQVSSTPSSPLSSQPLAQAAYLQQTLPPHNLQPYQAVSPPTLHTACTWPLTQSEQPSPPPVAHQTQVYPFASINQSLQSPAGYTSPPPTSPPGYGYVSSPTHSLPGVFPQISSPPPVSHSGDTHSLPDMSRLNMSQHSNYSQSTVSSMSRSESMQNFQIFTTAQSQAQLQTPRIRTRHDTKCDSCGADPIRGELRWHCQACRDKDEHICQHCKEAGVRGSHSFRPLQPWTEHHKGYHCDGCDAMPIYGIRRRCLAHDGEDWCDPCFRSGRCCAGPFKEIRQSSLGIYIEQYGGLPMPKEWLHYVTGPPVATYYMGCEDHKEGWLSMEGWREFYRKPFREMATSGGENPAFGYQPMDEHHTFSDDRYYWSFKANPRHEDKDKRKKLWDYLLKIDNKTGVITDEEFARHKSDQTIPGRSPKFQHGPEVDSLVFTAPDGRRQFRWLTNKPVSTLNGERWDSQMYALFERVDGVRSPGGAIANGGVSPQNERVVADMAWWDGHHDSPETAINIRDPDIDHSLVLATLVVLLNHQWRVLRMEKARYPDDVKRTERQARLTNLGRQAYWEKGDRETNLFSSKGTTGPKKGGKKAAAAKVGLATASVELAANMLELVNHVT